MITCHWIQIVQFCDNLAVLKAPLEGLEGNGLDSNCWRVQGVAIANIASGITTLLLSRRITMGNLINRFQSHQLLIYKMKI